MRSKFSHRQFRCDAVRYATEALVVHFATLTATRLVRTWRSSTSRIAMGAITGAEKGSPAVVADPHVPAAAKMFPAIVGAPAPRVKHGAPTAWLRRRCGSRTRWRSSWRRRPIGRSRTRRRSSRGCRPITWIRRRLPAFVVVGFSLVVVTRIAHRRTETMVWTPGATTLQSRARLWSSRGSRPINRSRSRRWIVWGRRATVVVI